MLFNFSASCIRACFISTVITVFSVMAQGTPNTFFFLMDGVDRPNDPVYPTVFPTTNLIKPYMWCDDDSYTTQAARHSRAEAAKAYLNALPDGRRCIYLWVSMVYYRNYLEGKGEAGVTTGTAMWDDAFGYYQSIGGKVDYVLMDFEGPWDEWNLNPPLNTEMKLHRSICHSVEKYFPNAVVGSYDNYVIDESKYAVRNDFGDLPWMYNYTRDTTYQMIGNINNPACYGWAMNWLPDYLSNPPGVSPFKVFYHDMVKLVGMRLSSSRIKVVPYFSWPTWNQHRAEGNGTLAYGPNVATQTQYWREEVAHAFMISGLDYGEMFTVLYGQNGQTSMDSNLVMSKSCVVLQTMILRELDEVIGYPDRQPLVKTLPSMDYPNMHYYLSGIYAGGKNVWRITPDSATVSRAAFKTSDNPITFKVGTTTIVFPTGSEILVPTRKYTQIGYWVTSPVNTSPTVNGVAVPIQTVTIGTIKRDNTYIPKSVFVGQPLCTDRGGISLTCNLPAANRVTFSILNATGQKVASVMDNNLNAGNHTLTWNGMTETSLQSVDGVYFAFVKVGTVVSMYKMVIVR